MYIGVIVTGGAVGGTPAAGVSVFKSITTAPNIYKQSGPAYPTGGSVDVYGVSIGAEYTLFTDPDTYDIYHGGTISTGIGPPIPLEFHTGVSYSMVWGFNIYDVLDKLYFEIMEW